MPPVCFGSSAFDKYVVIENRNNCNIRQPFELQILFSLFIMRSCLWGNQNKLKFIVLSNGCTRVCELIVTYLLWKQVIE